MRIKEIFWMLGLKPKHRLYGTKKVTYELPIDKTMDTIQWLYPKGSTCGQRPATVRETKTIHL
jgi:hypothetical protein